MIKKIKELFSQFKAKGSIFASSHYLAKAMIGDLKYHKKNLRLLEVGAGKGAITHFILENKKENDLCDVVEIDHDAFKVLSHKFSKKYEGLRLINKSILELEVQKYDIIYCSLPFNSLDIEMSEKILLTLKHLSTPKTKMFYFQYIGFSALIQAFNKDKREFFKKLNTQVLSRKKVFLNFPPAVVYEVNI